MDVEAVILAAGFSSRAGVFKMALDFDGKTMLQRNIEAMYELCSKMIVVGGYKIEKLKELVEPYPKVQLIYNENFEQGMFSSVKKGIYHVQAQRFLFTPGDYPLLTREVCEQLLNIRGQVVIPTYKGRKGHPIVLEKELAAEILHEPMESNLKLYLQKKQPTLIEVEEKGILFDVDTIKEYEWANSYYLNKNDKSLKGD